PASSLMPVMTKLAAMIATSTASESNGGAIRANPSQTASAPSRAATHQGKRPRRSEKLTMPRLLLAATRRPHSPRGAQDHQCSVLRGRERLQLSPRQPGLDVRLVVHVVVAVGAADDGRAEPFVGPVQPGEAAGLEQSLIAQLLNGPLDPVEGLVGFPQHLIERLVAVGLVEPLVDRVDVALFEVASFEVVGPGSLRF